MGGVYEVDKASGGAVMRMVTYYPVAGAMRINSTLYYTLKDHLGSTSVVTDSTGAVVGEQRYYPFGETRVSTGTIYTDRLFTGQQEITGLGIYNYKARFYSPKLGRFLSPDTIVPGYANPQNLDRFSYVTNNPLRYTDPTGHCRAEGCGDPKPVPQPKPIPIPWPLPNPVPWPLPNPDPEPGPIFEFPTEPMPITIGGPILVPIELPAQNSCQQLESQYYAVLGVIVTIDWRMGRLIDELEQTNDDQRKKEILEKLFNLEEERNRRVKKLGDIKDAAHKIGCNVSGWSIPNN